MQSPASKFALVPAAGSGSRAGKELPKQYLPLAERPLIAHAIGTLCAMEQIKAVYVVLAADDQEWRRLDWSALGNRLVPLFCGGQTRAASVANGLQAIAGDVREHDWVLVHDAARPCLTTANVAHLIREIADDPVGGILAEPVSDTLKRADTGGRIVATLPRDRLWFAQTPQMFRYGMLVQALARQGEFTDEAGAIEALGHQPKLVACDTNNLKVTWPRDITLAEAILESRKTK